jgi:hypothetical protein
LSNQRRLEAEIRAAATRLPIDEVAPEEVARIAIDCVDIELRHLQLQTNVNQQFDQILRKLGALIQDKRAAQ